MKALYMRLLQFGGAKRVPTARLVTDRLRFTDDPNPRGILYCRPQAPHVAVDGGAPADTTQRSRRGPRTGARRAWLAAVALGLRARQGRLRRRSTGAARSIDPAPARSQKPAAIRDRSITQARLRTSLAVAADAGATAIAVSATGGCHRRNPVMRNSRRDHRGVGYRRSGQFFSDDFVA